MEESASVYRYERMLELIDTSGTNTPVKTAEVLRDFLGKGNRNIGMGNEKAVNQFICHHGIIFQPALGKVWVSTSPWNLGEFLCYELDSIFQDVPDASEDPVATAGMEIPESEFTGSPD